MRNIHPHKLWDQLILLILNMDRLIKAWLISLLASLTPSIQNFNISFWPIFDPN